MMIFKKLKIGLLLISYYSSIGTLLIYSKVVIEYLINWSIYDYSYSLALYSYPHLDQANSNSKSIHNILFSLHDQSNFHLTDQGASP